MCKIPKRENFYLVEIIYISCEIFDIWILFLYKSHNVNLLKYAKIPNLRIIKVAIMGPQNGMGCSNMHDMSLLVDLWGTNFALIGS